MAEKPSIGAYVGKIAEDGPKVISGLKDMAAAEIGPSVKHGGIGAGLFGGAAGVAYFVLKMLILALSFLFSWIYAKLGLSILMALFCGFATMVVLALVLAVLLAVLGKKQFGKVHGPDQTKAALDATIGSIKAGVASGTELALAPKDEPDAEPEVLMHFVTDPVYHAQRNQDAD